MAVMVSLALGSILLLVCILGLLIICAPQRKLQNPKGSMANNLQVVGRHNDMIGKSSSSSSSPSNSIDGREDREILNCNGHTQKNQELCDNELDGKQQQQQQFMPSKAAINSMMMLGANQLNCQQDRATSNDQMVDSSDSHGNNNHNHRRLQSSLRQQVVGSGNHQQLRSSKFAAIHESLEHKLHLGQPLFAHHLRQTSVDSNGQQAGENTTNATQLEQQHEKQSSEIQTGETTKTEAVVELEEGSLFDRLWSRLLKRPEKLVGGNRRLKSRPIISMPVSSNIRRSSLSTSLSVLGTDSSDTASADNAKNKSLNLKRVNGINLVSSSANLIQDSTTASDGSGSSGRSSSNSSGQVNNNNNDPHRVVVQQNNPNVTYATAGGYLAHQPVAQDTSNWQANNDQLVLVNGQQQQTNTALPMTDCSLYVNDFNPNHLTYHRPDSQNTIYSRPGQYQAYPSQEPSYPMTSIGYTSQPLGWSDQSQSAPLGHYQHPTLPSNEAYFSPNGGVGQTHPQSSFYASICNNNKTRSHYGVVNTANNLNSNNNNYMSTLPHRPASTQCPQGIIPTSDAGEAFFDQNYGTMLSRSKAYTKLGYATSSALSATHYITAHSVSSSSSPHSSSSHTNTVPNMNLDTINQHIQAVTGSELPTTTNYNDIHHTTMVQTDAASAQSTTKHIDDNGLATHV